MIETIAIPVLLKAVDWLFGEGGKILQERRDHRKAQNENIKEESKTNVPFIPSTSTGVKSKNIINSKENSYKPTSDC
jgi:hypothetical protein